MANVTARPGWLSFHLFANELADEFLVDHVAPYVRQATQEIRRFFFIRHTDGGLHLRLRFLPRDSAATASIRAAVQALARELGPGESSSWQEKTYDRAALSFGDTSLSVYSELLSEQTSSLALEILGRRLDRVGKLVHTMAAVGALLQARSGSLDVDGRELDASISLVVRALRQCGWNDVDPPAADQSLIERLRSRIDSHLPVLEAADHLVRGRRLLRRLRRLEGGTVAATHAVHLFCNQAGYSLGEELRLFYLLRASAALAH